MPNSKLSIAVDALNEMRAQCDPPRTPMSVANYEANLGVLIKDASYDIWGGMNLHYNADNFGPYPDYRCVLYGPWGQTAKGLGHTAVEAILRAVAHREVLRNKPRPGRATLEDLLAI